MMPTNPTETLFKDALDVMNRAIAAHRDEFPYEQITQLAETLIGGRNLGVAVYKEDRDTPFDYFTLRLESGRFLYIAHGKQEPELAWKVSRNFLQQVAEDPQRYIDHPELLDWDWLKNLLGMPI